MTTVMPYIRGTKDEQYHNAEDVLFTGLKKFNEELSTMKPDIYYGANPSQIEPRVREDLAEYIVPSTQSRLAAAPNFFFEAKGLEGRSSVANNQALYYGAHGARGMFHLQNYGKPTTVYDGNAYTITSAYQAGSGILQMYSTHPREPTRGNNEPRYYATHLRSYAMTGSPEQFRDGAAAYRNAREWTTEQRDRLIAEANAATLSSPETAEQSPDSETLADKPALYHEASVKRSRKRTSEGRRSSRDTSGRQFV